MLLHSYKIGIYLSELANNLEAGTPVQVINNVVLIVMVVVTLIMGVMTSTRGYLYQCHAFLNCLVLTNNPPFTLSHFKIFTLNQT